MRGKIVIFMAVVTIAVAICGCTKESVKPSGEAASTNTDETGYESGKVQKTYVYYNKQLYVYNAVCRDVASEDEIGNLYKDYKLVDGKLNVQNDEIPNSEFEATNISKDAKIYALDDKVIIYADKRIMEMDKE